MAQNREELKKAAAEKLRALADELDSGSASMGDTVVVRDYAECLYSAEVESASLRASVKLVWR